jgi:DNA-binding NarL/FixJ family response regulator
MNGAGAPMTLRLLVVDDHPVVRMGLVAMLSEHEEFEVVGEAADGASGVDAARRLAPDVVVLDLQLPDTTGFAVAEEIAGDTAVVITSTHEDDDFGALARRSGARGFVSKSELSGAAIERLLP